MSGAGTQPVNLVDYAALARERLGDQAWAYFSGAAGDELTLAENRRAWDRLRLLPRVLRPLTNGHTRVELLGRSCAHPILIAPMAYQRMAHADGELAVAAAAAALSAGLVLSAQTSTPMDAVARVMREEPTRGPLWFQLYLRRDRGLTQSLVQQAEAAGFEAIVLTVDAPTSGARDRERRAGFRLPAGVQAVHLAGRTPPAVSGAAAGLCGGVADEAATWADVVWLLRTTTLPVLLKGVLHPDDARHAVTLGVAGIVVSNHGGRTLDTAVASATALPRIAQAVAGTVPLLVDGGIRRGTDVLKALALGASAVLVGQPVIHALAADGPRGVAHVLRLLRDEFEIALALTGCASPADIHAGLLFDTP